MLQIDGKAGQPLGGTLVLLRKLVFGNRQWRVIYHLRDDDTTAVVIVVGNRSDAECYREAEQRLDQIANPDIHRSLSEVVEELAPLLREATPETKRRRRQGRRWRQ